MRQGTPCTSRQKCMSDTFSSYLQFNKPVFSRNTNMSVGLGGCLQSRGFTASFVIMD